MTYIFFFVLTVIARKIVEDDYKFEIDFVCICLKMLFDEIVSLMMIIKKYVILMMTVIMIVMACCFHYFFLVLHSFCLNLFPYNLLKIREREREKVCVCVTMSMPIYYFILMIRGKERDQGSLILNKWISSVRTKQNHNNKTRKRNEPKFDLIFIIFLVLLLLVI